MDIEKARTALLLMDFQNDIVDPKGKFGSQGMAAEVQEKGAIENTARALKATRRAGLRVVHVAVAFRPGHPDVNQHSPLMGGIGKAEALVEGTWGAEFHPGVKPTEGELVVVKRGVSALAGTDLPPILRAQGIDTLVLTGIATTFVVEGTAREALDNGYRVIVLQDCCASFSEEQHQASLAVLGQLALLGSADEFAKAL